MSRKHNVEQAENSQPEGGDLAHQNEEQSTVQVEHDPATDAGADTPEEQSGEEQSTADDAPSTKVESLGIGQFVRHMLLHSKKTNDEILQMVLKAYEGSKTTAACIAWYKTDLRKKGLLDGVQTRSKNKVVQFTAEQLAELAK